MERREEGRGREVRRDIKKIKRKEENICKEIVTGVEDERK